MGRLKYHAVYQAVHILAGIITGLSINVSWVLPLVLAWLFITYELSEERRKRDCAYKDMREYNIGLWLTCAIMIARRVWL